MAQRRLPLRIPISASAPLRCQAARASCTTRRPAIPNFANVGSQTFPDGFNAQTIQQLYVARTLTATKVDGVATPDAMITIKGDLTATGNVIHRTIEQHP